MAIENPTLMGIRTDIIPLARPNSSESKKKGSGKSFFSLLGPKEETAITLEKQNEAQIDLSVEKQIEKELDLIHSLGEKLLKYQTFEMIQDYKAAVKSFVKRFVSQGLEARELVSNQNILNQRKYTIVKVLDEKLEDLVRNMLMTQTRQFDILAKLEEIQGLLVDLIH